MDYDFLYKIILAGDSGTGKTAILKRFVDNEFQENHISTIGVDFKVKTLNINGKKTKLQIWDLAGNLRFRTITSSYYKGSHGIILVYDVADRKTFENLNSWTSEIDDRTDPDAIRILVGNKIDSDIKQVSTEEGSDYARKHEMLFIECSAKKPVNIDSIFSVLINEINTKAAINEASGNLFSNKKSVIIHDTVDVGVSKSDCCLIN